MTPSQGWSAHGVSGRVALRKGWHPIRLRFLEYGHNDGLVLKWEGPGQALSLVTPEQLGHVPGP